MIDHVEQTDPVPVEPSATVDAGLWRSPAIWWPLILGVALLLAAIGLEHGVWVVADNATAVPAGADTVKAIADLPGHSGIFRFQTVVLLVSELGYAFIIAWVVSYFIETAARREQKDTFAESMSQISREVFRGVFGIRHKPEYVRAVVASCLETRLVREEYDLSYTVDAFSSEQEEQYELDPGRFVQVAIAIRYRARNIGTVAEEFTTSYGIPIRSGKLRELSALTGLRVGGRTYNAAEISALIVSGARPQHLPTDTMYRFRFKLEPEQSVEILIEAVLVKEVSDSETFGFGLPTMSAAIRLNMNLPAMRFGATPRIIGKLREVRSPDNGRSGEWKIDHPILPYNSVILWWRSREDDGLDGSQDDGATADDPAPGKGVAEPKDRQKSTNPFRRFKGSED